MDFRISEWISGFQSGFLDFNWISEFQIGFQPTVYEISFVADPSRFFECLAPRLRCLNGCNVSFTVSQIEDCLELNFRYVDYQTLAHLSCSSCVYWISACATRAQRFLSVRESISASSDLHCTNKLNVVYQ